jgi:2,5-diamino-6-(ribosylamino)-4(3H)-pyrimidinone 5'-phosphate reductase
MPDRPYVILNAAMSIDGKIATKGGRARISSPEDLARMQSMRATVDGIMIGINTLLTDDPSLRLKAEGTQPARIIVDSTLRTPPDARVFHFPGRVIIGAAERADPSKREDLARKAEVIIAGREKVDLAGFLAELGRLGLKRILLEGGGNLNWSMLEAELVDEITVAIAPVVIGGRDATTLVEGEGATSMEKAFQLELLDVSRYGTDVVLRLRPGKGSDDGPT